jgi:periplasmic protein TonB
MKKFTFLAALLVYFISFNTLNAQEISNDVFVVVEDPPTFPGGNEAIATYLAKNLNYPNAAHDAKIEGTVYASFIIEKDGTVSNVKIIRGIHPDCDAEVIRVISDMPRWNPGKQRGQPVRVQFNLPVKFRL